MPATLRCAEKGTAGTLLLTATLLQWRAATAMEPEMSVTLAGVRHAATEWKQLTPFSGVSELRLHGAGLEACVFHLNGRLDEARSFARAVEAAAAAARAVPVAPAAAPGATPAAAPAAAPAPATPAADPAAATAADPAAAKKRTKRLTKRVREGRKLRDQLREINRLRHVGKACEAGELASELEAAPAAAESKVDALARQRVRELRNTAFSFGGLELTRQIVRRFCDLPEVRPLLAAELLKQRRDAVDSETGRLLIEASKAFFGDLLKAPRGKKAKRGGRRTDINRNAHASALVAMLPANLFSNRRGRAAMRLLGLTYRQVKRGTETRREMEDRGGGWKRVKTSEHYDKARRRLHPTSPARTPPHLRRAASTRRSPCVRLTLWHR